MEKRNVKSMLLFGTHFIHLISRIFNDLRYELRRKENNK